MLVSSRLLVSSPHRLAVPLDVLDILETGRKGEAHSVRQEQSAESSEHSKPAKEAERDYLGETANLYQILAHDRSQGPAHPGHGAAGPHRRGPDGGGVELGGVDVGHVEGGRHGGLGTEGRLQIYEVRKWANSSSNAM